MNGLKISAMLLCVFGSVLMFLVSYIVISKTGAARKKVDGRIAVFAKKQKSSILLLNRSKKKKGSQRSYNIRFFDYLSGELALADMMVKPEEFLIFWLVVAFVPGGLLGLFSGKLIPACRLIFLGAMLPPFYIQKKKKKRTALFESQLGDALIIISNSIRSGLTLMQAIETGTSRMEPPISTEFSKVVKETKYGNSMEKALSNLVKRVGGDDTVLMVSAINIQKQTGGNLSDILQTISETIKERQKLKNDIRVLTATGRISGMIIGMLPVGIGLILLLINPDYIMSFFKTQLGLYMLIAAAALETIGFLFVKKIVTVKF